MGPTTRGPQLSEEGPGVCASGCFVFQFLVSCSGCCPGIGE